MIYYVPMCLVLALLGTILVNPIPYVEFFRQRKAHRKALSEATCEYDLIQIKKCNYSIWDDGNFPIALIVGQSLLFIVTFICSLSIFYLNGLVAIRWSTVLTYLWIPAIAQIINLFFDVNNPFNGFIDDTIVYTIIVTLVIFFVIPIGIACHQGIYAYIHPFDAITIMEENYEDCPYVDVTSMLAKADLAEGSSLKAPVYRNGNWIYPVVNDSSTVKSSGYLVLDAKGENTEFIPKEIAYSPWLDSTNNTDLVARREMPSAVLFGDSIFEIEPETGDIYFCKFYGDYECFRAGRKIEGAFLINATTGEVSKYLLDEIPDWVTGIAL